MLVGNRDDHLRNHGFIREPSGWRPSPVFDMNPSPTKSEHALTLDGQSARPSLDAVLKTAELYRLTADAAAAIVDEVRAVVATWRNGASALGMPRPEIQRMESVFLI